jgi:hypothetical protein
MKIWSGLLLLLSVWMWSCAGSPHLKTQRALASLTAGMSAERVFAIAGKPHRRYDFAPGKFVFYYQTGPLPDPSGNALSSETAVSFEDGKLLTIGQDLGEIWRDQAADELKRGRLVERGASSTSPQVKPAARSSPALEKERKEKIRALEEQVRPLPPSQVEQNLDLYRQLLALDPANPRYRNKVAYYQRQLNLTAGKPQDTAATAPAAAAEQKEYSGADAARGEASVRMTVVRQSDGRLSIWIRNMSAETLLLGPKAFRVVDGMDHPISFKLTADLIKKLSPGMIARGDMTCQAGAKPVRLIFYAGKALTITQPIR